MVRIYTRTGDGGDTSLGDGSRVSKSGPRVALYDFGGTGIGSPRGFRE